MIGGTEVLLCNLELHHHRRLLHSGKQRTVWFTRLEVYGAVLNLDDDIIAELAVQGHKLQISLVGTIGTLRRIDEGAPHHNALVRFEYIGQHVGTVGVCTFEVLWAWLALGVGLHQEAAEVRNQFVDFVHLGVPPFDNLGVERVGSLQSAHLDGRSEVDGEIDADAIGTQLVGNTLCLLQALGRECLRFGIYVVENGTIDTDGSIGTSIHFHAFRIGIEEDAFASKATLHRSIRIVPVVQDAQVIERLLLDVEVGAITSIRTRLPRML